MTHMRENRMIKTLPVHFPPWQIEQQEGKDQYSLCRKKNNQLKIENLLLSKKKRLKADMKDEIQNQSLGQKIN